MKERSLSVSRRLLMVVWLFVVFILTQIYTCSLSTLLSVDRSTILLSDNHFEKYNDEVRLQRFGRKHNTSGIMSYLEKSSRQFRNIIVVDSCPKDDWGYYDRKIAASVMYNGNTLCLAKERDWKTSIYLAGKKGIVDVLKTCRRACPKRLQKLTSEEDTCLHTAVMDNRRETSIYLLHLDDNIRYLFLFEEKISSFYMKYFLDRKSVFRLVVLSLILGWMTLVIYLLEQQSSAHSVDQAIVHILVRLIQDVYSLFDGGKSHGPLRTAISNLTLDHTKADCEMVHGSSELVKPSSPLVNTAVERKNQRARRVLLLLATVIAMLTFQAALVFPSCTGKLSFQSGKLDPVIIRSFVLFNSCCFVASTSIMIYLLHEFPLKPWPQVSVSTLFGSYMWLMKAISPHEALPVLFISIPLILMAATGKPLRFSFV